jgi:hypothetical protein
MRRILGVAVVLLLVSLVIPSGAEAQQQGNNDRARSRLAPNWPNPFNPETRFAFELFESDFPGDRPAVVTLRIRNVLGELVAIPEALEHPEGGRPQVTNLQYSAPGVKQAWWGGYNLRGQKVASGPYVLEIIVNGQRYPPRTIVVAK